jgi:hypothetical protein
MISSLPQLAELELYWTRDMPYMFQCLLDIHSLRRLVLSTSDIFLSNSISRLGTFIARNPNLSHITLSSTISPFDISVLMQHIPSERPLKLQHLSMDNCTNLKTLVPHVQSLQFFEFRLRSQSSIKTNEWCPIFCKANVFPSTIKVNSLDSELVVYLTRHPGVVSLTIGQSGDSEWHDELSSVLVRHSEKLRYLALEGSALSKLLKATQNRVNFLRCTGIEEMVLVAANPPVPTPVDSRFGCIRSVSTYLRLINAHTHS